jgi:hypothetical protein
VDIDVQLVPPLISGPVARPDGRWPAARRPRY